MTYQELVSEIRGIFMQADVSGIKEHIAYQFNIRGEAEGAFYAEVLEGKLYIEPYEYYDRDVLFTTTADTLLSIATGTMDAVAAFTLGKLQVEGSFDKALLLQSFSKQAGREKKKMKAEEKRQQKAEEKRQQKAEEKEPQKAEEKEPQKAEEKELQKAVEKESQKAVEKVAQKTEEKTAKKTVRRLLKK